jgi:small subunit ribosomal protein S9
MENIHTVGRRKTAVARVFLKAGAGNITINNKDYKQYFPTLQNQLIIEEAFRLSNTSGSYDVNINVEGGGINGQAEAIRLAISRALVSIEVSYKEIFKKNGLMKRDPRMVERKKPGQPKARKRFQFRKR